MKPLFYLSICVALHLISTEAIAQQPQISGGCSAVRFTGNMPVYEVNLFEGAFLPGQPCSAFQNYSPAMEQRMFLQRFNWSTGVFETVAGPVFVNHIFANLIQGTYRVKLQVPRRLFRAQCENNGHIPVFDFSGRQVGWVGHYSEVTTGESPGTFFSNEVVVGMTTEADIDFSFIDPTDGNPMAYDYRERVIIDTRNCKNYDRWMIAIAELGGQNRYMSTGWMTGKIGGNGESFDLTGLWQLWIDTWQFEPFFPMLVSYRVQVVLENSNCPPPAWTQKFATFIVCPEGTGCRVGELQEPQIRLGPNPAHSSIFLYNYDAGANLGSLMMISDMAGRTKKTIPLTGNEIDVSALPTGIYALQIVSEGNRVFSSKLVIAR